jgi:integrase
MAEGIETRVAKDGTKSYRASVWSAAENKRIRKTFPSLAAARAWRQDAGTAVRAGKLRATPDYGPTIAEAAQAWLDGARAGQVRNRSGDPYKPSAIRAYEQNLRLRVRPVFGERRIGQIKRAELQRFVDELVAAGHSPSTVQNTLLPLRAIYRRAVARGDVESNPTRGLEMPAVRRDVRYVTSPEQAERLLAALDGEDRALWATAVYAGLRRGELTALRWDDVDLAQGVIHVRRGWDHIEGEIAPKSREGRRNVPVPAPLRDVLLEHRMTSDTHVAGARVFRSQSWIASSLERAAKAWGWKQQKRDGGHEWVPSGTLKPPLERITLHEGRHTYASFMIAAGVNAKALSQFMGHSSIKITFDLYGHLMPGSEREAAGMLDAFLERANSQARGAAVVGMA